MVAVKENTVNLPKDEFRKMSSHNFKKGFCRCSTKTGTLLIGWSHFILCFVLFVIMTASAIYGTIELQEYLMKAEDDNLLSTETSTDAKQLTTLNYSDEKAQTTTISHETDKNKTWQEYLDAEKKDRDYYYKLYDDDLEKYPMRVPRWRREVGDETIGDGTAGDGTAGDGTAGDGAAGDGTAGDGTAGDGTAGDGTAGDGTAGDGTTSNETIGDETIGDETIGDETIGDGPISDEKVGNGKIVDESMDDVDSLSRKTKDIEDKSLEGFIDELSRENHEMLLLEAVNEELNEYGIYIAPPSKGFESSFGKSPTIKEFGVDDGELSSAGDLETKSTMDEDLDGYLNDKPSDEPTVESATSEKSTDNVDSTLEESEDSGEFRPFHGYGGYRTKDEIRELTNNGGDYYELAMEADYDELPTHEVNDELTNGGGADFDVQSTKGLDHEYESSTTFNGITGSNEESSSMEPSNDDDIIYEVQDVVPYNPVEYVVYGVLSALRGGSILFSKILGTIFGVAAIFHVLLLIGAHYDSTKLIRAWLIEQGVLIFLDLSLLMAMAFYSVGSHFIIIQSFRIGISLFCIVIVKGHLNNLNYTKKLKSISAV